MQTVLIVAGVIVLLLIIIGIIYNGFVKLRNNSDEAFSTMDVYLKRRYDLVPNLVDIVKRYAEHERGTFEQVVQARNMAMNARDVSERAAGDNMLSGTLRTLFAVAENYPELKANDMFMNLQTQLGGIESDILQARKYYNGVVKVMNNRIQIFPMNIFASMMGFRVYPFFTADEHERENVRTASL